MKIGLYSSESASIDLSNNQVSSVFLYEDGFVGLRLYTKSYDISPFIELSHFSAVENIIIDYDSRPVAFD